MNSLSRAPIHFIRAALVVAMCACAESPTPPAGPVDLIGGWTDFIAQPGMLTIHVSTSGDDAWPGTEAQPKRTIEAGYALLRDGTADWLLLKRGDRFVLPGVFTWAKTGPASSGAGWMRLGAYGSPTAPRPVLDSEDRPALLLNPGFRSTKNIRNLAVTDVHFLASTRMDDPANALTGPMAIQALATQFQGTGDPYENLLLENVMIQGYALGFVSSATPITNLRIRRSIFHHIFTPDGGSGGAQGLIGAPHGLLLEDNIFYQIQSGDIPGVVTGAYSTFLHSAYIQAEATDVVTRGNIVVKATETLMQRAGGTYARNVGVECAAAGLIGQANGVPPTPSGVQITFEESLLLNAFREPFYIGNTTSGVVRNNLFLRDQDGSRQMDLLLMPFRTDAYGTNIGVHNTTFTNNHVSGTIMWSDTDPTSYSGLQFAGNQTNVGTVASGLGAYLASIGWTGTTSDDWGRRLITRDRYNYSGEFQSLSIINFYRARLGLPPLS